MCFRGLFICLSACLFVFVITPTVTRGSLAKKIMFLHSKNKASRKEYKGEC